MNKHLQTEYDLRDPELVSIIDDTPLWSAPFGLKLLDTVENRREMHVLDIGSGTGFPVVELAQRLGSSCSVYGIEPWSEAVQRAQIKIRRYAVTNLQIVEGRAEQLPFENAHFDLVVSNNGINNVQNESKAFAEIERVAKPKAQLVLTVNLPESMMEFYRVFERVLREANKGREADAIKEHIASKRKPIAHTKDLIHKHGFDVLSVSESVFKLRYTDGTAMLEHFLIRLAFLGSWKAVVCPSDVEPVFRAVEQALNEVAYRQGGLELTVPWACFDCRKR